MNASNRAALRRRKLKQRALATGSTFTGGDEDARAATRDRLSELLDGRQDLVEDIEDELFLKDQAVNSQYRTNFRRIFISLKNNKLKLKQMLLNGELEAREFVHKPLSELKTESQQRSDREIHQQNIQNSIAKKLLPENIQQIKDGRDREKWGVSRSAAALD